MAERRFTMRRILKDPETVRAVTPDNPVGCNRVLLSRDWYPTLAREHVDVVGSGVAEITESAVVTAERQAAVSRRPQARSVSTAPASARGVQVRRGTGQTVRTPRPTFCRS